MVPGGCGGKRGGDGGLVWRLWGFRQEKFLIHALFYWNRETLLRSSLQESVDSHPALQRSFSAAVFLGHQASCLSAVVEDESPTVVERNLFGLPGGAYSFAKATAHTLVEALGLCAGGVPFLVEPVQVRVVIRDPFLDGLPDHKERTVCGPFGGRWSRAAAMKSGAVKI